MRQSISSLNQRRTRQHKSRIIFLSRSHRARDSAPEPRSRPVLILVTGGSGFLGRQVVGRLLAGGHRVRILTRGRSNPGQHLEGDLQIQLGDLRDPTSLAEAVKRAEAVVHMAAALGGQSDQLLHEVNVAGTAALAAAARLAGVRQFAHLSSAAVYGDGRDLPPRSESEAPEPDSSYSHSKLAAERALSEQLEGSETQYVILRPTEIHGSGRPGTVRLFQTAIRRRLWLYGPALVLTQPTFAEDVVNAIWLAIRSGDLPSTILNVAGDRILTLSEFVACIAGRAGRPSMQIKAPQWVHWGPRVLLEAARAAHLQPPDSLNRFGRPVINRTVNIMKMRSLLGFSPVPLETGIDKVLAGMRSSLPQP